jgi:hypothetical protein
MDREKCADVCHDGIWETEAAVVTFQESSGEMDTTVAAAEVKFEQQKLRKKQLKSTSMVSLEDRYMDQKLVVRSSRRLKNRAPEYAGF